MKIITCDSSLTCKKWPIWFTKNGHYHLFILSFSRIHFRIFAISVKTSSIFKTFFFAYASFFFKAKLLLLYFLLLLFTVHFEGFSLRLHFGLDFWRNQPEGLRDWIPYSVVEKKKNQACRKSGQTFSDSLPPNADDQFDLRSVIFYYIFYQNEKNPKCQNEEFNQCLQNDCVSFGAKRTTMPLQWLCFI